MGNFNRGGGSRFGGGDRGGRGGGGFGGSARPQMHQAVCGKCGDECEVPFRPTGDRPVFCSNCFGQERGESSSSGGRDRRGGGRSFERPSFGGDRPMYDAVCDKCHKDCQVPFRPSNDKPVYCSDCFDKDKGGSGNGSRGGDQNKAQFDMINAKLDKILSSLNIGGSKKEKEETKVKEVKEPKVEKEVKEEVVKVKAVAKKAVAKKKK